ncbi:RDD family protein [Streptomyces sp. YIM 98790]|uniref:RDD family protein n=1 Tax=Streptomyces sp. YIM 98790 TaxID=2689077 RepID=UPI00140748DE|nr:RDD family protein [Streptomyces sp. YIM 98790]
MSDEQPQAGGWGKPEREPGRQDQPSPPGERWQGPGQEPGPGQPGGPHHESAPPPPPPPGGTGDYGTSPSGGPYGAGGPVPGMPPLASLGRRVVARILDWLIIYVPLALITLPLVDTDDYNTAGNWGTSLLGVLVYFVYEALMLTSRGQTLGKMAMKIRVGMLADGSLPAGSPGWVRAAVYALPQLVYCLGQVFWLVNVLWCTWDRPYRQCLHDKAAKTVVVEATGQSTAR